MTDRGPVLLPGAFGGHPGPVFALAYAPGGALLASGGWDGAIRLWDTGRNVAFDVLRGHAGSVRTLVFSPDGTVLASAGRDRTVRLWSMHGRAREIMTLGGHTRAVVSLAFSPDAAVLASACGDGTVRLWDRATGAEIATLAADARAVAFSPDGARLISAGEDGAIRVWDTEHRTQLPVLGSKGDAVYALAYSPDGAHLAAAGEDGAVRIWTPGRQPAGPDELGGHPGEILSVAYSPDGSRLAAGDVDGVVRVWDPASATESGSFVGHLGAVYAVAFSPDGARLATAGNDGAIRLWASTDPAGGELAELVGHVSEILSVAYSPDGSRLATGDVDGVVRVWDTRRGSLVTALTADHAWVRWIGFTAAGELSAGVGTRVWVWNAKTFDLDRIVDADEESKPVDPAPDVTDLPPGQAGAANAVAVSPDRTLAASGGDDAAVRLWDRRAGTVLRTLTGHAGAVRGVAFAPDGVTLASVGDDGRVNEWHVATGTLLRGSGQRITPLPPVPGVHSDEPSPEDLLGMTEDVRTLAMLIAATGTRAPLAIALLGEWGAGKSSIMLQVHDAVREIAALSRGWPGYSLFAGNVRQVRFNAWHYSDDHVWTGLIDHLFRTLAADPEDDEQPTPDSAAVGLTRDRLRERVEAQRRYVERLGRLSAGAATVSDRVTVLFGALIAAGLAAGGATARKLLVSVGVPVTLLQRTWKQGQALRQAAGSRGRPAEATVLQAQRDLAGLQDQLAQVDAATRLAVLLRRADAYAGHRGLLGEVRDDLEQLDRALTALRAESGDAPPPLERIVLYIDDLDRCPPARVVEVLAAVHLMLALPLFVVVVAVDPRWLCGALREHYGDLLGSGDAADRSADPLDYLDKIFQIPFAVRRPTDETMGDFLLALLGDGVDEEAGVGAGGSAAGLAGSAGSAGPAGSAGSAAAGPAAPAPGSPEPQPAEPRPRSTSGRDLLQERDRPAGSGGEGRLDLRPGGLLLRPIETAFMARLGPLLPTPRAAKKLVNLYRLVRVGVPDGELSAFVESGDYRAVQILLAVLVGSPVAAPTLFAAIRAAAPGEDIIDVLGNISGSYYEACATVAHVLADIHRTTPDVTLNLAAFQGWCPQLARYSFHTLGAEAQ